MSESTHPCPIAGCDVRALPHDRLMCYAHWRRVPRALQAAVYYDWGNGFPTASYPETRQTAIDAVNLAIAYELAP